MENDLSPPQRRVLRTVIEQRLGLDIEMRTHVNLLPLIERFADGNPNAFHRQLQTQPDAAPVWQELIRELAIGETYFFRNQAQFRLLRKHIVPSLLRWQRETQTKRLLIWSAGCATGEEAYSLAILFHEMLNDYDPNQVTIIGTDISAAAIETARTGIYRKWSFRHIDGAYTRRYFEQTGDNERQIVPHIREKVIFRRANLLDFSMSHWANLILCRNVLLYFRNEAKQRAEYVLSDAIQSDGWLLLGHAEAIRYQRTVLQPSIYMGAIGYQRGDANPKVQALAAHSPAPVDADVSGSKLGLDLTQSLPSAQNSITLDEAALYRSAVSAFHTEAFDKAENQLARLLQQNPGHLHGRILLAAIFANRGVGEEAQAHVNTALKLDPLAADAHYLRALLYLEDGMADRAEASLRAALYAQTGHPLAAFTLGNLYAQRNQPNRARNLLQQALSAAQALPPEAPISDFNARTASDFVALVSNQLRQSS